MKYFFFFYYYYFFFATIASLVYWQSQQHLKQLNIIIDKSIDKRQQGEIFLLNQIFDENIRRLLQGKSFSAKKCIFLPNNFCPEEDVWYFRRKFGLIKNFSLLFFINWLINMIPRILIFETINYYFCICCCRRSWCRSPCCSEWHCRDHPPGICSPNHSFSPSAGRSGTSIYIFIKYSWNFYFIHIKGSCHPFFFFIFLFFFLLFG